MTVTKIKTFILFWAKLAVFISFVYASAAFAQTDNLTADAGFDKEVPVNVPVRLDGAGSTTENAISTGANILLYDWAVRSAPEAPMISDATSPRPVVTLPVEGRYVFSLTVTDSNGQNDTDDVVLYTTGFATNLDAMPIAQAGLNRVITLSEAVTLDGTKSYSLTGARLNYNWTLINAPAGSSAILSNADTPRPDFLPDLAGEYVAELTVTDTRGASSEPQQVTLSTDNLSPLANAGRDQTGLVGEAFYLDASGTIDPNGDLLNADWTIISRPSGSQISLQREDGGRQSLTPDLAGYYVIQLNVTDPSGASGQDTVTIFADDMNSSTPDINRNLLPVANAGFDRLINDLDVLQIDGTSSTDANGDRLTYEWSILSLPATSQAVLGSAGSPVTDFNLDVAGDYILQLKVTDSYGQGDYDTLLISTDRVNPVAVTVGSAQNNDSAIIDNFAALDGSASFEGQGLLAGLSYEWSVLGLSDIGDFEIFAPDAASTNLSFSQTSAGLINDSDAIAGLAVLQDYNVISFGDLNSNVDTEGKSLVGGNVRGGSATFGTALPAGSNVDALTVLGDIMGGTKNIDNGGNLRIKGQALSEINFNGGGQIIPETSLTITPLEDDVKALSGSLQALVPNSVVNLPSKKNGSASLVVGQDIDAVAVFHIEDGNDLFKNNRVQQIEMQANDASAIIVNVGGDNVIFNKGNFVDALTAPELSKRIIWNFYEASHVKIFRGFHGTILAPHAFVHTKSRIEGAVIGARILQRAPIGLPLFDGEGLTGEGNGNATELAIAQLAVTDVSNPDLGPNYASILLTTGNLRPVATISRTGGPSPLTPDSLISFDGGSSIDGNDDALSYAWQILKAPENSQAAFTTPTAQISDFTPDLEGLYIVQLINSDGQLKSNPITHAFTVEVSKPIADAGLDQASFVGDVIALDGSASSSPNSDTLSYLWAFSERPAGSQANLSDPALVNPTFVADLKGTYRLTLVVDDGVAQSEVDSVTVVIGNRAPVAEITGTSEGFVSDIISLSGIGSSDPDGDTLSYQWSLVTPAESNTVLSDSASATPSFTADKPGEYIVSLTVSDGEDVSQSTSFTVLIAQSNQPPVLNPVGDKTVILGTELSFILSATDPDADAINYFVRDLPLPSGASFDAKTGQFTFAPLSLSPTQYTLTFGVSDGSLSASETITLTVSNANAGATTSYTGQVVDASTDAPLENMLVKVGSQMTRTDANGFFTINNLIPGEVIICVEADSQSQLAGNGNAYASVQYPKTLIANVRNVEPSSVKMTPTLASATIVAGQPTVLEETDQFGVKFEIQADSVGVYSSRYWRILVNAFGDPSTITNTDSSSGLTTIAEVELREFIGGPTLGPLTTATASSQLRSSTGPQNTIDGNIRTGWAAAPGSFFGRGDWIAYDFGEGNIQKIREITLRAEPTSAFQTPTDFDIQISTNGINWVSITNIVTPSDWSGSEERAFNFGLQEAPNDIISISGLTPDQASLLPPGIEPCQLFALEPKAVLVTKPVSVTVQNYDNLPSGALVDIWAMRSGNFSIVGEAQVSNDGQTIQGQLPNLLGGDVIALAPKRHRLTAASDQATGMFIPSVLGEGNLQTSHALPAYKSLAQDRALSMVYNSQAADPTYIVSARAQFEDGYRPQTLVTKISSAGLQQDFEDHVLVGTRDELEQRAILDARNLNSGLANVRFLSTGQYACSKVTSVLDDNIFINNQKDSPYGAGWSMAELQTLNVTNTGVAITDGTGKTVTFSEAVLPVTEGFDNGFNGWSTLNPSQGLTFESDGGNPGGYIQEIDQADQELVYWITPPELAARVVDFIGGEFSYDLIQNNITNPVPNVTDDLVIITDEIGTELFFDLPEDQQPGLAWTNFSVSLTHDGGWQVRRTGEENPSVPTKAEFQDLLSRATEFRIRGEFRTGPDVSGLDNPTFTPGEFTSANGTILAASFEGDEGDFTTLRLNDDGTFTRRYPNGTTIDFNADGRQVRTTDRNGNVTSYTYDDRGRVMTITDPVGLVTSATYVGSNLSSITDPSGRETFFVYDSNGALTRIENPEGEVKSFDYDDNLRLIAETDRRGLTTTHSYGLAGAHTGSERPDGTSVALNIAKTLGLDSLGTADAPREPIPEDQRVTTITDGRGNVTTTEVNGFGSPVKVTDPLGRMTIYERNADDLVIAVVAPSSVTPSNTVRTEMEYDEFGNVILIREAVGTADERVTLYEYEPEFSRLIRTVNADGFETVMEYDAQGNMIRSLDPEGGEELSTYDGRGLLLTRTDKNGNISTYEYDLSGRLERMIDPNNVATRLILSEVGNVLLKIEAENTADERRITMGYDAVNRMIIETAGDGGSTRYEYDGEDNLVRVVDPTGIVETRSYDDRNRVSVINDPATGSTVMEYDADNNVIRMTDALGETTDFTYDAVDRLQSSVDAKGQLRAFAYDLRDNITAVTDARANITIMAYDALDRPISRTNPKGESWNFAYDGRDNRLSATKPDGVVVSSSYDGLSRMTALTSGVNGQGIGAVTRSYSYDAQSNLLSANDNLDGVDGAQLTFSYDNENRVSTAGVSNLFGLGAVNNTFTYSYDALDRRAGLADSFSGNTTYTYDPVDRLIRVTTPQGNDFVTTYDLAGRTLGRTAPNAVEMIRAYEQATGRLASHSQTRSSDSTVFNRFDYDYSARGNITEIDEGGETVRAKTYSYDALERLTDVSVPTAPSEAESYVLDPEGNRESSHLSSTHETDAANRLASDDSYTYLYDLNGNLTGKLPKAGTNLPEWGYSYDALDQLIEVRRDSLPVERYRYDAFGRRSLIETANDNGGFDRLAMVNDGADRTIDVVEGPIGTTLPLRRYTHSDNVDEPLLLETFDASGSYQASFTYHADHLGSIRYITDAAGQIVAAYDYDSYGRVTSELALIAQPFSYTGREWDEAAQLYHYRARGYDPTTGRFIQEDPIGFAAGDLNIYRYVGSNPIMATDPSGLYFDKAAANKKMLAANKNKKVAGGREYLAVATLAASGATTYYVAKSGCDLQIGLTFLATYLEGAGTGRYLGVSKPSDCVAVAEFEKPQIDTDFDRDEECSALEEAIDSFKDASGRSDMTCNGNFDERTNRAILRQIELELKLRRIRTELCYGGVNDSGHARREEVLQNRIDKCKRIIGQ